MMGTSLHTLVQMVGSGLGVTFLPGMAVEAGLAETAPIAVRPRAPIGQVSPKTRPQVRRLV